LCPKGLQHAATDPEFVLWFGAGITGVTDDAWDRCTKCEALFNFAGSNDSICPAGGKHNAESPSQSYKLVNLY
jgi:hypothetical protein